MLFSCTTSTCVATRNANNDTIHPPHGDTTLQTVNASIWFNIASPMNCRGDMMTTSDDNVDDDNNSRHFLIYSKHINFNLVFDECVADFFFILLFFVLNSHKDDVHAMTTNNKV